MTNFDLKLSASGIVRLYLWDMLQTQLPDIWKPMAGGGIPIIPAQDQPETQVSENPYIVYVTDTMPTTDLFSLQTETMHLRIFSQSAGTLNRTVRLLSRLMNKWDVTARDLNRWVHHEDGIGKYLNDLPDNWMEEAENFQFRNVRLVSGVGIEPSAGEGRRMDTSVSLSITFIEKYMGLPVDPKTKRPNAFVPEELLPEEA